MDEPWAPQPGDAVVITRGLFEDKEGIVERFDEEKCKVSVRVSFFGRDTPVELDLSQIKKLDQHNTSE
jgi:transcriptional antiterminator NusG